MARTEIDKYQILNRQLTGSDLNNLIGIYDETQHYNVDDVVLWNATKYRCKATITGMEEGNLTNAPHADTTHWVEVGFSGISPSEHLLLDQLVHDIVENAFLEIIKESNKVVQMIIWADDTKLLKIRECSVTRSTNKITSIVTKQYDASGNIVQTLTQTINRTAGRFTSMTQVLS